METNSIDNLYLEIDNIYNQYPQLVELYIENVVVISDYDSYSMGFCTYNGIRFFFSALEHLPRDAKSFIEETGTSFVLNRMSDADISKYPDPTAIKGCSMELLQDIQKRDNIFGWYVLS